VRRFVARKCLYCAKAKGTMAFRWWERGEQKRDYFHPACFSLFQSQRGEIE
jgi:hypothetical protein